MILSLSFGSKKVSMKTGSNLESLVVPKSDEKPRDLRSWAKKTDFVSDYSGEAGSSGSEKFELFEQRGRGSSSSTEIEIGQNKDVEIQRANAWCCCWFKCLGNRNVKPVYMRNEK
ncbi:hypothetical protein KIW84_022973 [Lathyrus oleraceus]|uniref:Uncharacterized protein n=1 Tax=Pisum sativum TaxID=3888 RepID=A0A9D4YCZ0_PEA|nr:hypothetical protein KIW84_022973 [Pisum sativum]